MKKLTTLLLCCMAVIGMQAQDTWTVAGSSAIFGSEWNVNDEANNMTLNNDLYELVKTDCVLEAGATYKFKVVKNHSWDEAYPGSDYEFQVTENGKYTVTVTFNESTHAVAHQAEKTGDAVIGEKTWTVAGDEALMGSNWKPENTENDMVKQDNGTYKLEIKGRTLEPNWYYYKICANHAWSEAYGKDGGGDNAYIDITEAGTYDIVFTFNPSTTPKGVSAVATKQAATAIDNTAVAAKPTKLIRNGQVLILRDGKIFDLTGAEVK